MTGDAGEKRKYHPGMAGVRRRLPPAADLPVAAAAKMRTARPGHFRLHGPGGP
jgi:hypothetical protein